MYATGAPGDRASLFVVEQGGRVKRVAGGHKTVFLDLRTRVLSGGEQGLLSIAFHPKYAQNRRFFVNYTNNQGDTRVVGFRANAAGTRGLKSTAHVWLGIDQPFENHNGGQLAFGNNGLLYIGMGDGGDGNDPGNRAQRMSTRLGKLLALDVDIRGAAPKIVALGLRNPWRFSVDRKTGVLWIGDVGQGSWEEVDRFVPSASGLENYGWERYEGHHLHDGSRTLYAPSRRIWPVAEYSHSRGRCSMTGGFVARSPTVPQALGRYFYGDYCTGEVWSFRFANGSRSGFRREPFTVPGNLSSFGRGARGAVLLVSHNGGRVFRLNQS